MSRCAEEGCDQPARPISNFCALHAGRVTHGSKVAKHRTVKVAKKGGAKKAAKKGARKAKKA